MIKQMCYPHAWPSMGQSCQKLGKNPTSTISMLKILQARLQQYVNCELSDVQAGFRKGRGTRDQIANIRWIIKKSKRVPGKKKNLFLLY